MGKQSYLAMRAKQMTNDMIASDFNDLTNAAKNLVNHAIHLGGLGFGSTILEWVATGAAIYLLVLDRTNWKTNILTGLLIPYIFFSLPSIIFNLFRGDVGRWVAFVCVVLRLFFPKHFPDWAELPAALILLIVVAPSLFASTFRGSLAFVGLGICLAIACYLLQEHIRASGGFKKAFTKTNGLSNSIGILLLFVFPAWALITYFF